MNMTVLAFPSTVTAGPPLQIVSEAFAEAIGMTPWLGLLDETAANDNKWRRFTIVGRHRPRN